MARSKRTDDDDGNQPDRLVTDEQEARTAPQRIPDPATGTSGSTNEDDATVKKAKELFLARAGGKQKWEEQAEKTRQAWLDRARAVNEGRDPDADERDTHEGGPAEMLQRAERVHTEETGAPPTSPATS